MDTLTEIYIPITSSGVTAQTGPPELLRSASRLFRFSSFLGVVQLDEHREICIRSIHQLKQRLVIYGVHSHYRSTQSKNLKQGLKVFRLFRLYLSKSKVVAMKTHAGCRTSRTVS
jgi:hypothetical protein